jgi:cytosine deaminase
MYDLVLRQAHVHDLDDLVDIAIQDAKIARIAGQIDEGGRREIRLGGRLVQPGFVNSHLHPTESLTWDRSPNESGTFEEGLKLSPEVRKTFSPQDVRQRVRKLLNLGIRHGTTAFRVTEFPTEVDLVLEIADEYDHKADIQVGPVLPSDVATNPNSMALARKNMERGCTVVGGWPFGAPDHREYIDAVFGLAREFDTDIDIHIDYEIPDAPTRENMDLVYLAEKTIEEGYEGRVTAGHVCAIGSADPELAHEVIQLVKDARVNICTLAAQNVFMHGKSDAKNPRRGITRVRDFLEAGVNVAYATDDIRDLWNPYGNADMLFEGMMLAHVAQMASRKDMLAVWEMGTYAGARIMGMKATYGVSEGKNADLVVFDAPSAIDAFLDLAEKAYVFKEGNLLFRNHSLNESYI